MSRNIKIAVALLCLSSLCGWVNSALDEPEIVLRSPGVWFFLAVILLRIILSYFQLKGRLWARTFEIFCFISGLNNLAFGWFMHLDFAFSAVLFSVFTLLLEGVGVFTLFRSNEFYGAPESETRSELKSRPIALLLVIFFGSLGAHRFYIGRKISARIMMYSGLFIFTFCRAGQSYLYELKAHKEPSLFVVPFLLFLSLACVLLTWWALDFVLVLSGLLKDSQKQKLRWRKL